ncbi:PROTEIN DETOXIFICATION [Salix purpurea]|uniref:PROTEIN DETOXIFICATION n=1 Tax=Salix purpurea TaxID=77065 RepID=A0A9Q0Z9M6_SALPP|nr:PROTEIN DETOXIFICATION [Salix purpurea]
MASALETLCGQAYGAKQYTKLGTQTYTAIFCLILVCIPISVIWIYMGKILHFIGQDPAISREAGRFTMWLVPALFAYATLQPLTRYFQTQSFIMPMLISSCATLCFHIPLCWALVYKSGLNNVGAALCMGISYWLNVIFLGLYMRYSPACAKTRAPISKELFYGIGEFFRFAIPSAVMICLQAVLSGVARGCGWQNIGAYINLGAFHLCGIPVAALLGFWLNLKGMGLWIGIQIGVFTQTALLSIVTSCTNWEKQARMARDRIFEGHDSGLM